jgi:hypothetical protein
MRGGVEVMKGPALPGLFFFWKRYAHVGPLICPTARRALC